MRLNIDGTGRTVPVPQRSREQRKPVEVLERMLHEGEKQRQRVRGALEEVVHRRSLVGTLDVDELAGDRGAILEVLDRALTVHLSGGYVRGEPCHVRAPTDDLGEPAQILLGQPRFFVRQLGRVDVQSDRLCPIVDRFEPVRASRVNGESVAARACRQRLPPNAGLAESALVGEAAPDQLTSARRLEQPKVAQKRRDVFGWVPLNRSTIALKPIARQRSASLSIPESGSEPFSDRLRGEIDRALPVKPFEQRGV